MNKTLCYGDPMLLLAKIGGSVVAPKGEEMRFEAAVARRLARELGAWEGHMVLIHGAGSFAHTKSERYGIHLGRSTRVQEAEVMADVMGLSASLAAILASEGIPAVSVPPHAVAQEGTLDLMPFLRLLDLGFVPMGYGDVVPTSSGPRILSGDDLMVALSKALRPELALFITDVEGIYDRDPKKHPDAKLLEEFDGTNVSFGEVEHDVTGGMSGKASKMLEVARNAKQTWVVSGLIPGRVESACKWELQGTRVVP